MAQEAYSAIGDLKQRVDALEQHIENARNLAAVWRYVETLRNHQAVMAPRTEPPTPGLPDDSGVKAQMMRGGLYGQAPGDAPYQNAPAAPGGDLLTPPSGIDHANEWRMSCERLNGNVAVAGTTHYGKRGWLRHLIRGHLDSGDFDRCTLSRTYLREDADGSADVSSDDGPAQSRGGGAGGRTRERFDYGSQPLYTPAMDTLAMQGQPLPSTTEPDRTARQ